MLALGLFVPLIDVAGYYLFEMLDGSCVRTNGDLNEIAQLQDRRESTKFTVDTRRALGLIERVVTASMQTNRWKETEALRSRLLERQRGRCDEEGVCSNRVKTEILSNQRWFFNNVGEFDTRASAQGPHD